MPPPPEPAVPAQEITVFVHGIWMTGLEMTLLRRRVAACGHPSRQFRYPSLRATPAENALALRQFIESLDAQQIQLVAHSLGGIVVCHLLAGRPPSPLGRILMLGTPLRGSAVARHLQRWRWTRWMLGRSTQHGLLGDFPPCPEGSRVGMIAGDCGLGIGNLLPGAGLAQPNDGTVALAETEHPIVSERLVVGRSHFGLLLSRRVATAVCRYLRTGHFDPPQPD